jgi:hypothetical protein
MKQLGRERPGAGRDPPGAGGRLCATSIWDVRTTEIARMLGGQITETSRAHAQAMLATARAQEAQDAQDADTATPAAGKAPRRRKEAA